MLIDADASGASAKSRTTREDWLGAARAALIERGVDHVKVLTLAERLGVSRSSFYWHFRDRPDLLDNLVQVWRDANTADIVEHALRPSRHIVEAVLSIFECWRDGARFDPRLDFAMREWSRRDPALQGLIRREDEVRVDAIATAFRRHGYRGDEAFIRARVLYFMQIGYYALGLDEGREERLRCTAEYVLSFTGVRPDPADIERFKELVRGEPAAPAKAHEDAAR